MTHTPLQASHSPTRMSETTQQSAENSESKSALLSQLISRLSLSHLPAQLPCRNVIASQLAIQYEHLIRSGSSGTSYLSGMPGTGKSVCLRWVLGYLQSMVPEEDRMQDVQLDDGENVEVNDEYEEKGAEEQSEQEGRDNMHFNDGNPEQYNTINKPPLPLFEVIWINALKLNSPKDAYSRIWDTMELYTDRPSQRLYAQKLANIFYGSKKIGQCEGQKKDGRPYFIIVIDELDYLVTKSHDVIYELFNWPQQSGSRLLVIGIANTIDIKSKLPHKVGSRIKDTECIVFQPYNHFELEEILVQRFGELKDMFITDEALSYLCHRVASSSGDIRQLFAFTIEILQAKGISYAFNTRKLHRKSKNADIITKSKVQNVLDEIIEEYPPTDLPLYDQLFLICTLLEENSLDQNVCFERVVVRCQTTLRKALNGVFVPSIQMWWPVYERLIAMQAIREHSGRTAKSNFPVFFLYGYASYQIEQLIELDTMKDYKELLMPALTSLS